MEHWLNDLALPSVDLTGVDTIHSFAQSNDVEAIIELLELDPHAVNDRNDQGFTPLHICATHGMLAIQRRKDID